MVGSHVEPTTLRRERGEGVYYTVQWSSLCRVDRYQIICSVPSMSGIYELYYMDRFRKLNRFHVDSCWYGGLRNTIRAVTDPELTLTAPERRRILESNECYYRYSLVTNIDDMKDIVFFLTSDNPPGEVPESSMRYSRIFVKEDSPDHLIDL